MINFSKTVRKNLTDPTDPPKTYAMAQARKTIDLEELSEHMASHHTPFSSGAIEGVLKDMVVCMRHLLLDGNSLKIGKLGTFHIVLESQGIQESVEDEVTHEKPVFSAANITGVNLRFVPGKAFENMINDASFNEVETLDKQAEHLKAKKLALSNGTYNPNGNGGNGGNGGGGNNDDDDVHE